MSDGLRWAICGAAVGIALFVLNWPNYYAGSLLWIGCAALLTFAWPRVDAGESTAHRGFPGLAVRLLVTTGGGVAIFLAAAQVLPAVFAGPPDPNRADMLPLISSAIDEFLRGGNPYRMHRIAGGAWEVPLSYGPLLWMPYVLPHVLQFDVRIFSFAGQLVVPAAAAIAAATDAHRSRWLRAAILAALSVALSWDPQYLGFFPIGHTQIYWPLLLVFAILVAEGRWTAACVVAGLLCAARTTMVSIVPVLLIALYVKRELSWWRVALVAIAAIGPFVPFLVTAPDMVVYGLYGMYLKVVKNFVWTQTSWAVTTYGLTRWLLLNGLQQYLEAAQAAVMIGTYALAYLGLRRGHAPLPWMAFALLAFCMTTVWPVLYTYLDVWTFVVAGLAATSLADTHAPSWRRVAIPGALAIATFAIVLAAGARVRGASYAIDIGTPASEGMTGGGFGRDTSEADGDRTYVWVEGQTARVRVPRAGLTSTQIHVTLRPFAPVPGLKQTVTALLNDRPIGGATLTDSWQDVPFDAPRSRWLYGFNVLTLEFGYATSASQTGTGTDTRQLSVAVDRVWIAPR